MGPASSKPTRPIPDKEYAVKSAFIYNFLKYTSWPKSTFKDSKQPIVLGIVGKDPFGPIIDKALKGKKVQGRSVTIRRFSDVSKVKGVHVLFLGELSSKQRASLYAQIAGQPILTIGNRLGLAGADTCVASFYLKEGQVRFEVSLKAIERCRLKIGSGLLQLADVVEKRK